MKNVYFVGEADEVIDKVKRFWEGNVPIEEYVLEGILEKCLVENKRKSDEDCTVALMDGYIGFATGNGIIKEGSSEFYSGACGTKQGDLFKEIKNKGNAVDPDSFIAKLSFDDSANANGYTMNGQSIGSVIKDMKSLFGMYVELNEFVGQKN